MGVDFSGYYSEKQEIGVAININAAVNQNKLVAYPDFSQSPYAAGINALKIGQPLNLVNLLHYSGVDPQTGYYAFIDKNHDGNINWNPGGPGDDSYAVDLAPKLFGGFGINLAYESLTLNLFFNYKIWKGQNGYLYTTSPGVVNNNQPVVILGKQWQYPGQDATIAKFTNNGISTGLFSASDGSYTDASFLRLSNVSVSYTLPVHYTKKAGIQGCSIFGHMQNLWLLTNYKGLDPETQNFGGLPPTKAIVAGINFNF